MSMLLMNKAAQRPFYFDRLNVRLYTGQELCYVIYHYPLLALDGLVDAQLIDWMEKELGEAAFAQELRDRVKAGESQDNLLLLVLQTFNYYTMAEVRAFRNTILDLKKLSRGQLLRKTGITYYRAGFYRHAEEKLNEAVQEMSNSLYTVKEEKELMRIRTEKADTLCDLVGVLMLRFDRQGAMELLALAEEAGRFKRAEEYRFLISGQGQLTAEEKEALEKKRRSLEKQALESSACRRIREKADTDSETFLREAEKIVCEWKKDYRKTS